MNEAPDTQQGSRFPAAPVTETTGHHLESSDAHFESEHGLFTMSPAPPTNAHDFIDVASFLEMGHVPNCWCRPCQDMYDHDIDDESLDLLEPADEEWMICSTATCSKSPSTCSAWEWEWGTLGDDESAEVGTSCDGKSESGSEWKRESPSAKAHGAW